MTTPVTYSIQTLNVISEHGLGQLPADRYEVTSATPAPDAIVLRSANLHHVEIPESVLAIARAGAGTNNIPIAAMTARGVPVFNTPGANANAVKELVLAGTLLMARNLFGAALYVRGLEGTDDEIAHAAEVGKKKYVGYELPGRTMGVIGLGAIGVQVANAALSLGLKVVGYDPLITVRHAWQLSSDVERADSIEDVLRVCDFVTVHVPLVDSTRNLIDADRLKLMKRTALLMNFARGEIVDSDAVVEALDAGQLGGYLCDFPSKKLNRHPLVMALPHLGASTVEAEDNCAVMAVAQVRDFLETGQITNSVNFPEARLSRTEGTSRLVIVNSNVPNMVGQVTTLLAEAGLNIADLLNKSRDELALTLVDVDGGVPDEVLARIRSLEGVLSARVV